VSDASDYVERNRAELERMRALVERLSDAELERPVNESWTVAAVLGHIAFWDGRALYLAEKLQRGEPFTESDQEPEDADWINDSSRPLIHAIPPRQAAELALSVAEQTDQLLATMPPKLVGRTWPSDQSSPLNASRADHRGEHLDEIEASFRD
jgi:hypothetical protein